MSPSLQPFIRFALVLAIATIPAKAFADSPDLRRAGSDAQFRVVDRFPDQRPAPLDLPSFDDDFEDVVDAVRLRDWSTAWSALNEGDHFVGDHAGAKHFLAGYIALAVDEPQAALRHFDAIDDDLNDENNEDDENDDRGENSESPLQNYIAYHRARAALETGDAHSAILAAAAVADDSRLYAHAVLLQAEALLEAGEDEDRQRAAEILELYTIRYDRRADAPRALLLLGDTLRDLDRRDDAATAYLELRQAHPLTDQATTAQEHLEAMAEKLSADLQDRIADTDSPEATLNRYRSLYNAHRSDQVVDGLPDHLDRFDDDSPEYCESLFMIAHSYTKLRRHGDGTPFYDQVIDTCEHTGFALRALYLGGRGRWNVGDRSGAMTLFERIYTDFEDHSFADDAMYFTGRILRSEDQPEQSRQILANQVQRYPDGDMAKDAHWLLVRPAFEDENYDQVIDYVDDLSDTGEDDLYTRGRLHYFRARALDLSDRRDDAATAYRDVLRDYPMSYYALLAINRLHQADPGGESIDCQSLAICAELFSSDGDAEPIDIPSRLRRAPAFERGVLLLALGLVDDARAEFQNLRQRFADDDELLWALALLLDRADAYPFSHDIARRHIDGWMDHYPTARHRHRWAIAYPTPFKDLVAAKSRAHDVPMALIYAIMREESGFNPQVESWANARGLLQLIEDTADRMADRTDLSPYSFRRLFEPDVNIDLGAAYLDFLGDRLNGHPALIMASYNAGSTAVRQWLNERGHLPLDLFVEDIPYGQTRRYTKRVMMSYWIYHALYDDHPVPSVTFELPN